MKRQILKILLTIGFMLALPLIISLIFGLICLGWFLVTHFAKLIGIILGIICGLAILSLLAYCFYECAEEVLSYKENKVDLNKILVKYRGQINQTRLHPENKQYQIDVAQTFQELVTAQKNEQNTKTFICNFNIPCDITLSDFSNVGDPTLYVDVNVGKQLYHVNHKNFIIGTKNRIYLRSNGSVDKIEVNSDTVNQINALRSAK